MICTNKTILHPEITEEISPSTDPQDRSPLMAPNSPTKVSSLSWELDNNINKIAPLSTAPSEDKDPHSASMDLDNTRHSCINTLTLISSQDKDLRSMLTLVQITNNSEAPANFQVKETSQDKDLNSTQISMGLKVNTVLMVLKEITIWA